MLKHWRKLPQAGVGLLGLALLFTLPLNAQADPHSFSHGDTVMFGGTASQIAAASPAVVTPPSVSEFSSAGSGILNLSAGSGTCSAQGLSCSMGDICQCFTITGNVTDGQGPLFQGPFVFYLEVDLSHLYNDGSGKVCFFADGVLAETPGSDATINFITAGAACNGIDNASALYSGGFTIGPSTGGFDDAVGSGVVGFGANTATGIGIFDLKGAASDIN
jgi:hypothetical protein